MRWMVACTVAAMAWTGAMALKIGGGGDAKEIDLSQTFDFSVDPAVAAETYVVHTGNLKTEKIKRIAVATCTVGYVYAKGASGFSSGGSRSYQSTATAGFPGGVPAQRAVQAINTFCWQVESDLKAAGFDVVPYDELAAKPAFQKWVKEFVTGPLPLEEDIDLGNQKGGEAQNALIVLSGELRPFPKDARFPKPSSTTARVKLGYEKDLEGITLVSVNTTLDFAKATAKGGFWHGAKADIEYGQFIPPGEYLSNFQVFGRDGFRTYWQKQAIVAAKNPFKKEGTGKVTRDGDYEWGSGTTTLTTTTETKVDADHALWAENAEAQLKALSAMFVQALKNAGKD